MPRTLVSADSHVLEPATLWQERLPPGLRDRGPRVEARAGRDYLVVEGVPPRRLGATGEPARLGGTDLDERRADLARDGVRAEVIYPTVGLFVDLVPDPELQMACARVYNDWCAELFHREPETFLPAALVPLRDVELAVGELERVAGLGYRTVMIPTTPPSGARYNDPVYDKLWAAASAHRMPVSLHVGTGALPQAERGPGGAVVNYAKVGLLAAETLCYLVAGGALDRFPELHVVFVESGGGWLGYCCERMDEAYREHAAFVEPRLSVPPSELVRRQCHVTLGADRSPLLNRELTGVEPLMWASDYPHPEGTFPESRAVVERIFRDVPSDDVDRIVAGNAAAVYGINLGP